ncbi:MAG: hypothetical protein C5B51_26750 [Terriglobia bacterium]|nr:MAG: hypothetical protein C5B51_26750 [Terriglobia bacterium]
MLLRADSVSIVGASRDGGLDANLPPAAAANDTVVIALPGVPRKPAVVKPPVVETPKPALPPEFRQDGAGYLQRLIGKWALGDARVLLGEPLRHRPSFDDDPSPVGEIYSFADPSNQYKGIELDFDRASGLLHGVFVYPAGMTWQECRQRWGAAVEVTKAPQGRTFYSYTNRRLDILVDGDGKVISLGMY